MGRTRCELVEVAIAVSAAVTTAGCAAITVLVVPVHHDAGVAGIVDAAVTRGHEVVSLVLRRVIHHETGTGEVPIERVDAD